MKRFIKPATFIKIASIILVLTLWGMADMTALDIQKPKIADSSVQISYELPKHNIMPQSDSNVPKHWTELMKQSDKLISKGKYKQAKKLLKEAIDLAKSTQPVAYREIIQSLNALSKLYSNQKQYDKASIIAKQAIKISKSHFGSEDLLYASSLSTLAYALAHNNQLDKAMKHYQNALTLHRYELHIDDPAVADIYLNIGYIYQKQQKYEKSIELIDRAVVLITNQYGINSQKLLKPYVGLADAYSAISQYDEAKLYYKNSIDVLKYTTKPTPINSYILYKSMTQFYIKTQSYNKAELVAKKYIATSNKIFGAKSDESIVALKALAQIYQATNNIEKKRAIDEQIYGPQSKTTDSNQTEQKRNCQEITVEQDVNLYQEVYKHYSKLNADELSRYDLARYDLARYDLARYDLARYDLAQYGFARYYIAKHAVSLIVPLAWEQKSDNNSTLLSLSKRSASGETIEFSLRISTKFWNSEEQKLPKELLKKASETIANRYIESSQQAGKISQVAVPTKIYDYNSYIVAHHLLSTTDNNSTYRGDTLLWDGNNIYILSITSNKSDLLLEEFLSSLVIESFCSNPDKKKQTDRKPLDRVVDRVKELERRLESLGYENSVR